MAVLLGITYEIGQAAVLFSILMSDNNKKFLPWALMILLTALQVTANVYASFKFMDSSGSNDWTFWQRSILFWLEADGPEMFKVVISWISGALLPVVALGMTALVAENLKLKDEQDEKKEEKEVVVEEDDGTLPPDDEPEDEELPWEKEEPTKEDIEKLKDIASEVKEKPVSKSDAIKQSIVESIKNEPKETPEVIKATEEQRRKEKFLEDLIKNRGKLDDIPEKERKQIDVSHIPADVIPAPPGPISPKIKEEFGRSTDIVDIVKESMKPMVQAGEKIEKIPENNPRGWHLKKYHQDINGDIYSFGKFVSEGTIDPIIEKVIKKDSSKKV